MQRALTCVILLLVVAGCTKPSEPAPTTPTPDDPTPPSPILVHATPTPSPTPASPSPTPPPPSPTPATPTPTPTTPTPRFVPQPVTFFLNITHDYTTPGENKTFEIPNGTVNLTIDVDFTPGQTPTGWACAGAMRVVIGRPDTSVWGDVLSNAAQGVGDPQGQHCGNIGESATATGGPVVAGNWTADFQGQGIGFGRVYLHPAT